MSAQLIDAPPDFDLASPSPALRDLRAATERRDWPAVFAHFAGLTDPNDHEYAARLVTETPGSEEFFRDAARSDTTTLADTLHAARLINIGWDVRTGARANNVSRQQFASFHDYLRQAERILIDVTARDPGNTTAWVMRLKTVRGLQLGQTEARRRYDQVRKHAPDLYNAQAQLVQQFCPKWSGSHEKAHAFGLECLRAAAPGSLGALAIVEAHIERFTDFDEQHERHAYLARPDVRAEIYEAADRSVRHPAFRAEAYRAVTAHNLFALIFGVMQDHAAAAQSFRFLGNRATELYWAYLGDEKTLFARYRKAALKGVPA